MSEIEGIARLRIQPGKLEEFGPVRILTPYQSL
jgi:hypothetical protein